MKDDNKKPLTIHVSEEQANWMHPQTEEHKLAIQERLEEIEKRLKEIRERDNKKTPND